jgi:CRISPR-associated protein Cas5h
MKAFSVDFKGEMALFKKNDANDLVFTSYNFLHKPAILGLFGAILGFSGYSKSGRGNHPEYFEKLKDIEIAIEPLFTKPLQKVITGFNNATGHANKGEKKDGATWQVREQILVGEPEIGFRVYVKENDKTIKLKEKLQKYETVFPLYFGKNEFFAHYEKFKEYEISENQKEISKVSSLVLKKDIEPKINSEKNWLKNLKERKFIIFEQLPYNFDENGFYLKDLFTWTNYPLEIKSDNVMKITEKSGDSKYVQFV